MNYYWKKTAILPSDDLNRRLLQQLLRVIIIGTYLISFSYWIYEPDQINLSLNFVASLAVVIAFSLLYPLSYWNWRVTVWFLIGITWVGIFFVAYPNQERSYPNAYLYLLVPVLLSLTFFGEQASIILTIVSQLAVMAFAAWSPYLRIYDLESYFMLMVSALMLVILRHQRRLFEQQQAELCASETRYRQVVELSPDPIAVHDGERYLYANPSALQLLGLTSGEDIVGQLVHSLWSSELQPILVTLPNLVAPQVTQAQYQIFTPTGEKRWVEINSTPIVFQGQLATLVVGRDLTSAHGLEQQKSMLKLEKERNLWVNNFVREVAHDLKNLLAPIRMKLYLLERPKNLDETQMRHLNGISHQVTQLDALTENLSAMVRLDNMVYLDLKPLDWNLLMAPLKESFNLRAEEKALSLQWHVPPDLPPILAQPLELARVFTNLLENALRYTPASKMITVRAFVEQQKIIWEIQDEGIGIPAKDLPRIFDEFYRSDQARKMVTGGTGLGLAIVKRIITMHNATIKVESMEGQGTTFCLAFPLPD